MTFDSLVSQIRATLGNNDPVLTAYIPTLIQQAQDSICSKSTSFEMVESATLRVNPKYPPIEDKPPRWKRPLSCHLVYKEFMAIQLEWRSLDFMKAYDPKINLGFRDVKPLFWGDFDNESICFYPASPSVEIFNVQYYALPTPLGSALGSQTNILTEKVPNALLYGSLLQAANFIKEDERLPKWQAAFEDALGDVSRKDTLNKQDRYSNRGAD